MIIKLDIIKRKILFIKQVALFVAFALLFFNKPVKAENIDSAVSAAINYNTSLTIAKAQNEQAKAALEAAKALRGPNLSLSGNGGYYKSKSSIPNLTTKNNYKSYGFSATIRQSIDILSGSKISKNVRANNARLLSSNQALEDSRALLILDTILIYSDLDYTAKVVSLRKNSFATFAERLRITRAQLRGGEVSAVDLAQTQMSYYQAIIDLENAKNQYLAKENEFANITGRKPVGKLKPIKKATLKVVTLAEARQKMLENSKNLKRVFQLQKASRIELEIANSQFFPSTNLVAKYDYTRTQSSPSNAISKYNNASIILQLQLELYDGGLRSAQIDSAKNVFVQSNANLEETKRKLTNQLATAWNNYNNSLSLIKSHKRNIKSATKVRNAISAKQKLSEVTRLQLLDADLDVTNAQVAMAQEQRMLIVASYQITYLLGILDKQAVNG